MVVLHGDGRQPHLLCEPRGQEVGMQVVRDELRRDLEQSPVPLQGVGVRRHRLVGVEVADVLGQERLGPLGETEGAVQLGARPQRRGTGIASSIGAGADDRARRSTTGSPRQTRVTLSSYRATIWRSWTTNASAMPPSRSSASSFVDADRLVAAVAARHHQRALRRSHQEVVQRRGRQHRALPPVTGGDGSRERPPVADQHDRRARGCQDGPLAIVEVEALGRVIEVGDHHREGFGRATLALAQFGDGSLVRRITGQMEPTEPLERDDLAGRDQFRGPLDRVGPARPARCVEEPDGRSARGAGDRLGVEPPIGGIAILTLARHRTSGTSACWCARGRTGASR